MKFSVYNIFLFLIIAFNAGVFGLYGVAKLAGLQFVHLDPPPDLLFKDVMPHSVMWYFFGLKKGYGTLVALAEIVPAILIIFKRTRFLGSLLYLITATNILAINFFFDITPWTMGLSIILFTNTTAVRILKTENQLVVLRLSGVL